MAKKTSGYYFFLDKECRGADKFEDGAKNKENLC